MLVPAAIVLGVISLIVVLFYGMQKYAVITKDAVAVKLPFLTGEENPMDAEIEAPAELEAVSASVVFDPPDYSGVETVVDGNVQPLRAIFVHAADINSIIRLKLKILLKKI